MPGQAGAFTEVTSARWNKSDLFSTSKAPGCPDCHCASIKRGRVMDMEVRVYLPSDGLGTAFTLAGYTEIRDHEARRESVYRKGYDAFLETASGASVNVTRCGLVCSSTPGKALAALQKYLVDLRTNAWNDFLAYSGAEQDEIDKENDEESQKTFCDLRFSIVDCYLSVLHGISDGGDNNNPEIQ